jgi:hypothetical protein
MTTATVDTSQKMYLIPAIAIMILGGYLLHEVLYGEWSDVFVIVQAAAMCVAPYLVARKFALITPFMLHVGLVCFFIGTLVLGEVNNFYKDYWWWDVIMHGVAGGGLTIIGFIILVLQFGKPKVTEHAMVAGFFALSFALGLSVLWEIYEYLIDSIFTPEMPMQGGNTDTMTDFIIATIGGIIVGGLAYWHFKYRQRNIVGEIIEEGKEQNGGA